MSTQLLVDNGRSEREVVPLLLLLFRSSTVNSAVVGSVVVLGMVSLVLLGFSWIVVVIVTLVADGTSTSSSNDFFPPRKKKWCNASIRFAVVLRRVIGFFPSSFKPNEHVKESGNGALIISLLCSTSTCKYSTARAFVYLYRYLYAQSMQFETRLYRDWMTTRDLENGKERKLHQV